MKEIRIPLNEMEKLKANEIAMNSMDYCMAEVDRKLERLMSVESDLYLNTYSKLWTLKHNYPELTVDHMVRLIDTFEERPEGLSCFKAERQGTELVIFERIADKNPVEDE